MKERDVTFDIMKGIAMILIIMGHTVPWVDAFPYWRSALFFIVSGYFAKEWSIKSFLLNASKRLFIPYWATCAFMLPFIFVENIIFDVDVWGTALKSIALGASSFDSSMKFAEIEIGPLWFIYALFWVRFFWLFISRIKNVYFQGLIVILLAGVSCVLKENYFNPWSILSSFGAMGFFFSGYVVKKYEVLNSEKGRTFVPIALSCLVYCICFSKMSIVGCFYEKGYIVSLLASVGAFTLLYATVQKYVDMNNRIWIF